MAGMAEVRQPRATGLAEELGYTGVFLPEIAGRDTLAALTGLAGETSGMLLGTGVVPMGSRSPMLTAMAAATVQERSGGRAVLGLGAGAPVPGALDHLRELAGELRRLLEHEVSLAVPAPVPIWLSALGPRALRLAGEVADGVLLNWCPPERVAQARAAVSEGAAAAGRDPSSVRVVVYVRASLGEDHEAADLALREAAGQYASYPAYARQFAVVGLEDETGAAARAHAEGRPRDVPEALLRAVTLPRDPAAAAARLQEYRDAGADLPVVYPVVAGEDVEASLTATIRALAPV
jgi:alkanesulfonate monooxygenase SsuD/methylene tetrahydromethanopterin reductase-like flavin-dependent oxidoreductase (luciferase family)